MNRYRWAQRAALAVVFVGEILLVVGTFRSVPLMTGAGMVIAVAGAVTQFVLARHPRLKRW